MYSDFEAFKMKLALFIKHINQEISVIFHIARKQLKKLI